MPNIRPVVRTMRKRFSQLVVAVAAVMLLFGGTVLAQKGEMMVRISEIEIHSQYLEQYKSILKEEAAASVRLEPGVIAIFPMYQQADPTQVRILEIYRSREAYESHLKTPHFQTYKTTTLKMVKLLKLVDMEAMDAETMTRIFAKKVSEESMTTLSLKNAVPAMEKYAEGPVADLWKRRELDPRDRSIATVAALIARNQTIEMPQYFNLALDDGVKPRELSEIITHLAFYSGWANAVSAAGVANDIFAARHISADQLPAASPSLLALNKEAEEKRASGVEQQFGTIAPGIVQYTTDVLFRDLWLRPDLAPRDRSLVTVAALIATGQVAQITYHLNRAMDNGLTAEQTGEVVTHLAFYAGWPNAFSALPVVKDVIEKRTQQTSTTK
jgi:4-carboxymuconolactone decarboxylase